MSNSYFNLIDQTYYFPQEGFDLKNNSLTFHGVSLKHLIKKHGTPFRFIYLPKISDQIKKARNLFNRAIKKNNYSGTYTYCYCTKCNHFSHVVAEALKNNVQLETSSAFDIELILNLLNEKKLSKSITIICNGYKTNDYLKKIVAIQKMGFSNIIVVLDSTTELSRLSAIAKGEKIKVGIRMAINEEPQSSYYTSRLGIRENEVLSFYESEIKKNKNVELKMLHFFVDSGIKDTLYYWGEFQKALQVYVDLKKLCKSLDSLNLGGGFPIRNNLRFEFDYDQIANEIISGIKKLIFLLLDLS